MEETIPLFKFQLNNIDYESDDYWWEERDDGYKDFHIKTKCGKHLILEKCYISSIKYDFGIAAENTDSITLIGNNKLWNH